MYIHHSPDKRYIVSTITIIIIIILLLLLVPSIWKLTVTRPSCGVRFIDDRTSYNILSLSFLLSRTIAYIYNIIIVYEYILTILNKIVSIFCFQLQGCFSKAIVAAVAYSDMENTKLNPPTRQYYSCSVFVKKKNFDEYYIIRRHKLSNFWFYILISLRRERYFIREYQLLELYIYIIYIYISYVIGIFVGNIIFVHQVHCKIYFTLHNVRLNLCSMFK